MSFVVDIPRFTHLYLSTYISQPPILQLARSHTLTHPPLWLQPPDACLHTSYRLLVLIGSPMQALLLFERVLLQPAVAAAALHVLWNHPHRHLLHLQQAL